MNKETKKRQKYIRKILLSLKRDGAVSDAHAFFWESSIDIYDSNNKLVGFLYPVGFPYMWNNYSNVLVPLLAKWRSENIYAFKNQDKISIKKTEKWLENNVYENEDKILFMIYGLELEPIGHIGLAEFDYERKSCEIDNVVRGNKYYPGMMTYVTTTIINWTKEVLDIHNIHLRVLKSNRHAIEFYKKNNFIYNGEDEEFTKMKLKGE